MRLARPAVGSGNSVCVDNTNLNPGTRAKWRVFAEEHGIPCRAVIFRPPHFAVVEHLDFIRTHVLKERAPNKAPPARIMMQMYNAVKEQAVLAKTEGYCDVMEVTAPLPLPAMHPLRTDEKAARYLRMFLT